MAFSRAKRFVYKTPEPAPSPADYVITTTLEKGYSIPKSPRFRKPVKEDEVSPICSRDHSRCCNGSSYIPNFKKECSKTYDQDSVKKNRAEFNRSDIKRKSIRRKSLKSDEKLNKSKINTPRWGNNNLPKRNGATKIDKMYFYENEEFIDDDYDSFTSSEEILHLKRIDEFEFNGIWKSLESMQDSKSSKNQREASFEEIVLTKLENIENNVENFKEDFAKLHQNRNMKQTEKIKGNENYFQKQICIPSSEKYEEINSIVRKAIKYLSKQFELKRKSMDKDCEEKIRTLISDMYVSSKKSKEQMNVLCSNTTEKLLKRINDILHSTTTALEFTSIGENAHVVEDIKQNGLTRKDIFNYENMCNVLSHHLQQAKEEIELVETDDLDITLKFADTQEMLELQGVLIGNLRDELGDLKQSLYKQKN